MCLNPCQWTLDCLRSTDATVGLHTAQTIVLWKVICKQRILTRTCLHFVIGTVFSRQMLTYNDICHMEEAFSLWPNPSLHCTGQMSLWHTACMACGFLMSTLWTYLAAEDWPRIFWATNTSAFYWWQFECTWIPDEILRPAAEPSFLCHHLMLQNDTAAGCNGLYTVEAKKHPSSWMAGIPTRLVTQWACLECPGSLCTTACSSSCQYSASLQSHSVSTGSVLAVFVLKIWQKYILCTH